MRWWWVCWDKNHPCFFLISHDLISIYHIRSCVSVRIFNVHALIIIFICYTHIVFTGYKSSTISIAYSATVKWKIWQDINVTIMSDKRQLMILEEQNWTGTAGESVFLSSCINEVKIIVYIIIQLFLQPIILHALLCMTAWISQIILFISQ